MSEILQFNGGFKFEDHILFDRVNFELNKGKWHSLLGSSGVGKSTLLRLILGLETGGDFSGDINSDVYSLSQDISYMAQSDLLLPWLNVLENLCLGARLKKEVADKTQAQHLLKKLGLEGHQHKFPNQLSGGMRQRVALGRTLMEDKPIILLDEPFSALDAYTRIEMQNLTHQYFKDKTVLLVTHDPMEAARMSDEIFLLKADGLEIWQGVKQNNILPIDDAQMIQLQRKIYDYFQTNGQMSCA